MTCSPDFHDKSDIKLIDFGLATFADQNGMAKGNGGTEGITNNLKEWETYLNLILIFEGYSAPELLNDIEYTYNVDMWSLGVTAYILYTFSFFYIMFAV